MTFIDGIPFGSCWELLDQVEDQDSVFFRDLDKAGVKYSATKQEVRNRKFEDGEPFVKYHDGKKHPGGYWGEVTEEE